MERWHSKALATLITLVLMLIVVFTPFKIVAKFKRLGNKGNKILATLSCFTGGIFLGTSLLFLIPEVINLMELPKDSGFFSTYPTPEAVMALGFASIMFLERFVHSCRRGDKSKKDKTPAEEKTGLNENSQLRPDRNGSPHYVDLPTTENETKIDVVTEECLEIGEREESSFNSENTTKAVILFIALSMDEFLGGISLGLQRTTTAVWGIMVGLLAHECVVGFSFGLQLASLSKTKPSCLAYALGLSYSLVAPLGAIVGTLIGELSWSSGTNINYINGVLQALATGVFLYVTFFEILEGKINSRSNYLELVAVTAGLIIMGLIAAIPREEIFDETDEIANTTVEHLTTMANYS